MASRKTLYINQFENTSTVRFFWIESWNGQIALWKAFWLCLVFGHGIVIGLGLGLMVIVMSLGLIFIPNSLDAGFFGLVTAGSVLGLCYSVFAIFW